MCLQGPLLRLAPTNLHHLPQLRHLELDVRTVWEETGPHSESQGPHLDTLVWVQPASGPGALGAGMEKALARSVRQVCLRGSWFAPSQGALCANVCLPSTTVLQWEADQQSLEWWAQHCTAATTASLQRVYVSGDMVPHV